MKKFKSVHSFQIFARKVLRDGRYFFDNESKEFLDTILANANTRVEKIPAGSNFWRAQLGHSWEKLFHEDEYIDDIPCPFPPERMKPLPNRAFEGRANPKGIPYLYGANKKDTALAEIRPWIGSIISLAQFKIKREIILVNFTQDDGCRKIYLQEPDLKEKEKAIWTAIDCAFSKPINRNGDLAEYAPTQIIAELLKKNGFDGIGYRSVFGGGVNIVLFDLECAELRNCTLYVAKDIDFNFQQDSNPYFIVDKKQGVHNHAHPNSGRK
ncbi:MAG: RES family NAD+ phosphorylase [Desulfosalsimonadaceae bacterium]